MQFSNLIENDQFTEQGFVKAFPQAFDSNVRFRFRPLSVVDVGHLNDLSGRMDQPAFDAKCASMMESQIVEWDVAHSDGTKADITAENILRLKPVLFNILYGIVSGQRPSDLDPEWSQEEKGERNDTTWQSVQQSKVPGLVREEGSTKN